MKVGDLVRDTQFKDIGLIIKIQETAQMGFTEVIYHVLFVDGATDQLTSHFLEVICK